MKFSEFETGTMLVEKEDCPSKVDKPSLTSSVSVCSDAGSSEFLTLRIGVSIIVRRNWCFCIYISYQDYIKNI